jgi:hypothetical protein
MASGRNPAEVIATIAESIRVSRRGARRVRAYRFKELFGYQALTVQRRERIEQLVTEAGIVISPALADAGHDEWLSMSMSVSMRVAVPRIRLAYGRQRRGSSTCSRYGPTPSGRSRSTSPRRCSASWATPRSRRRLASGSRSARERPPATA